MRIVLQRVKSASVKVDNKTIGRIGKGFLVLLGAEKGDTRKEVEYWADKCAGLRVFEDNNGKMNLALSDVSGEMLVVSQFTLCAKLSKGRRPSFDNAMPPVDAEKLYESFCKTIADKGITVQTGSFGAKMDVELINDGPVTLILEN
ncbi:MAG: D-tyrosyl-tRNA(Tyr) deacylase [candidate division Zixibacteria bacterium]|nr:D-tyrosyl-tRNA(Tyr) deacylase [candidate division Zixibacteria bacterium]